MHIAKVKNNFLNKQKTKHYDILSDFDFISETPLNYSSNEKAIPRQNLISVSAQKKHTLKSFAEEHKQDRTAPVPNADFLY